MLEYLLLRFAAACARLLLAYCLLFFWYSNILTYTHRSSSGIRRLLMETCVRIFWNLFGFTDMTDTIGLLEEAGAVYVGLKYFILTVLMIS